MIGKETIDRVRELTGIVSLIGETVKLQKRGRSHLGLCPFHKEKTPSFHVNDERGIFHCFGCGVTGDIFKFVQETEGLSFREAVEKLAERCGVTPVDESSAEDQRLHREKRRRDQSLFEVSNAAAAFFERMLETHSLSDYAKAELGRRDLLNAEPTGPVAHALQSFRVGYAPFGWSSLTDHLRQAGLSLSAAEEVGLIVPRKAGGGHYDRFRHRLMFAVIDLQGRVVAFSGRALPDPDAARLGASQLPLTRTEQAEAPAKYLNSPESPIYRKREIAFGLYQARQSLRAGEPCVVVEGNFDVVSLHARGFTSAVAPLGTAFTPEQAKQIARFASEVILLFDADGAGRRAIHASRPACDEARLRASVAVLPDGTDPDDFVRTAGATALRGVLGAARGLLEYLVDAALDSAFTRDDAKARAARIQDVADLLSSEANPAVRAIAEQYADSVVARLGISDARTFEALARQVRDALRHKFGPSPARPVDPAVLRCRDRRTEVPLEVLGALLDYPELFDTPEFERGVARLEGDVAAAIATLRSAWDGTRICQIDELLPRLNPTIAKYAAARLAAPQFERPDVALRVLTQNSERVDGLENRRGRSETVEKLHRLQATGNYDQQFELLRELDLRAKNRMGS